MAWPDDTRRRSGVFGWLREQVWLILIVLVLALNVSLIYQRFFSPVVTPSSLPSPASAPTPSAPAGSASSPLNGVLVDKEDVLRRPVAVMVDNFPSARPQSGLSQASIVWETLVEGGVTRFLAIFQTAHEVTIGPVRSARDYFLPWAREMDAIYAHSGGSPAGLAALRADSSLDDADEFKNGQAYFRTNGAAPHNLYTTTMRLAALATDKGWHSTPTIIPWLVDDAPPATGDHVSHVTINFSSIPAYRVQWRYDEAAHRYLRSQGGVVVTDGETEQQLSAVNVVILFAKVIPAPPPAPPEAVEVASTGSGEAWFLRDGRLTKGRWEKPTAARTTFLAAHGQPYALARGSIWVAVVPSGKSDAVSLR